MYAQKQKITSGRHCCVMTTNDVVGVNSPWPPTEIFRNLELQSASEHDQLTLYQTCESLDLRLWSDVNAKVLVSHLERLLVNRCMCFCSSLIILPALDSLQIFSETNNPYFVEFLSKVNVKCLFYREESEQFDPQLMKVFENTHIEVCNLRNN